MKRSDNSGEQSWLPNPLMSTVLAQVRKRATCVEQAWAEDWFSLRQRSNSANSPAQSARIFLITGLHQGITRNIMTTLRNFVFYGCNQKWCPPATPATLHEPRLYVVISYQPSLYHIHHFWMNKISSWFPTMHCGFMSKWCAGTINALQRE